MRWAELAAEEGVLVDAALQEQLAKMTANQLEIAILIGETGTVMGELFALIEEPAQEQEQQKQEPRPSRSRMRV